MKAMIPAWLNRYVINGTDTRSAFYALLVSVALFVCLYIISDFVDKRKKRSK